MNLIFPTIVEVSSCTGLHIIQPKRVYKAFKKGPIGLFHLFIPNHFFMIVFVNGPIETWTLKENLTLQLKIFLE